MTKDTIKRWMERNRYSSHKLSEYFLKEHDMAVSAETIQRWMRGLPVTEQYRKTLAKVTKLRFDREGKVRPSSFQRTKGE